MTRCVLRSAGKSPMAKNHAALRPPREFTSAFSRRRAPRSTPCQRDAASAHRLPWWRPIRPGRADPVVRLPHRATGALAVSEEQPLQGRREPCPAASRAPSVRRRRSSSRRRLRRSPVRAAFRSSRSRWSRPLPDPLARPPRPADPRAVRPAPRYRPGRHAYLPVRGIGHPHGVRGAIRASRGAIGSPRPARSDPWMEKCRVRSTPPLRPRAASPAFHGAGDRHHDSGSGSPGSRRAASSRRRAATARRRLPERALSSHAGRRDGHAVMAFETRRRAASAPGSRRTASSRTWRAAPAPSARPVVMIGRKGGQAERRP